MDEISVKIPVHFLIQIATYGDMGKGELPDLMKRFADRVLRDAGYMEELSKAIKEKMNDLRVGLRNVLGDEGMNKIDEALGDAVAGIQIASKLNTMKRSNTSKNQRTGNITNAVSGINSQDELKAGILKLYE